MRARRVPALRGELDGHPVEPVGPALSSMRECAMVLAETPVSLRVHNEMAAADDGRMSLLFGITLTTDAGT